MMEFEYEYHDHHEAKKSITSEHFGGVFCCISRGISTALNHIIVSCIFINGEWVRYKNQVWLLDYSIWAGMARSIF